MRKMTTNQWIGTFFSDRSRQSEGTLPGRPWLRISTVMVGWNRCNSEGACSAYNLFLLKELEQDPIMPSVCALIIWRYTHAIYNRLMWHSGMRLSLSICHTWAPMRWDGRLQGCKVWSSFVLMRRRSFEIALPLLPPGKHSASWALSS